jgi:hypothetical protein
MGEESMEKQFKQCILSAAIVFAFLGVAQAKDKDDDGKGCRNSTLDGLYVFHATGFNVVGGIAQPKAIVELIHFNGDGTLTTPAATVSINGIVTRSLPGGGSYTIESDCTGSLAFGTVSQPGPTYDLFVGFKDSEFYMIQTGPGSPVFQGTVERVSR